jgi:hypothetical protein
VSGYPEDALSYPLVKELTKYAAATNNPPFIYVLGKRDVKSSDLARTAVLTEADLTLRTLLAKPTERKEAARAVNGDLSQVEYNAVEYLLLRGLAEESSSGRLSYPKISGLPDILNQEY